MLLPEGKLSVGLPAVPMYNRLELVAFKSYCARASGAINNANKAVKEKIKREFMVEKK